MFHLTMFFYSKLYIQQPGDIIFLTQAVIFSSTNNFVAAIATLCNNMQLQVKNLTNIYGFCFCHSL